VHIKVLILAFIDS